MKYDFTQKHEIRKFYFRAKKLVQKQALVDMTDKSKRSLSQNNYLHLICTAFALEYGSSLNYVKQKILKKVVCPDIFVYEKMVKNGERIKEVRSTADIPKEQMTEVISRFKEWSAMEAGIDLPNATDQEWLRQIEIEASRMAHYLK